MDEKKNLGTFSKLIIGRCAALVTKVASINIIHFNRILALNTTHGMHYDSDLL